MHLICMSSDHFTNPDSLETQPASCCLERRLIKCTIIVQKTSKQLGFSDWENLFGYTLERAKTRHQD